MKNIPAGEMKSNCLLQINQRGTIATMLRKGFPGGNSGKFRFSLEIWGLF